MSKRSGFTLIEVLISIALLSMVMLALYSSLKIQRISNKKVHDFLDRSLASDKMIMVLYNDILHSNGVISKQKADMGPVCIDETSNSLYGLSYAKVCWLVGKNDDTLLRVEGNDYKLPIRSSVKVELDTIAKGVKIFSITRKKDKVLVVLQLAGEKPYAFAVEGIEKPKKKKTKAKKKPRKDPKKQKKPKKKKDPVKSKNPAENNGEPGEGPKEHDGSGEPAVNNGDPNNQVDNNGNPGNQIEQDGNPPSQ